YIFLLFLFHAVSNIPLLQAATPAEWHGHHVHPVIDQDLIITANTTLPTHSADLADKAIIEAVTKDVLVTLDHDITLSGSSHGESQLYLFAEECRTIIIRPGHNFTIK